MNIIKSVWQKVQNLASRIGIVSITEAQKQQIDSNIKPYKMKSLKKYPRGPDLNTTSQNIVESDKDSYIHDLKSQLQDNISLNYVPTDPCQQYCQSILKSLDVGLPKTQSISQQNRQLQQTIKQYQIMSNEIQNIINNLIPSIQTSYNQTQLIIDTQTRNINTKISEYNKCKFNEMTQLSLNKLNLKLYSYQIQYPQLKAEQLESVKHIFKNLSYQNKEVLRTNPINSITYKSFCSLNRGRWLNDEVINTYIDMMKRQIKTQEYNIMNTFFAIKLNQSNLQRFIKKFNISSTQKLVIPVHWNQNHWMFVTIIEGVITLHDSMNNTNVPDILFQLSQRIYGRAELQVDGSYPKQKGYQDCGVYMLCGIKSVCYELKSWGMSQTSILYKRLCIAKDILNGEVSMVDPLKVKDQNEFADTTSEDQNN